jgi:hypothetical protein
MVGLYPSLRNSWLKRAGNAKSKSQLERFARNIGKYRHFREYSRFAPFSSWQPLPFRQVASGVLPACADALHLAAVTKPSAGAGGARSFARDGAGAMTTGQREYSRSAAHGVETLQRRKHNTAFITQRYIFLRRFGSLFARGQSSKII